jgi:membrane protein
MTRTRRTSDDGRVPRPADGAADRSGGSLRRPISAIFTHVGAARARARQSAAGDLASRLHEADLINRAMNLAAMILMIFFPFVITLAALSPLRHGGAADVIIGRMGLSHDAAMAVERLFTPRSGTVLTGWTVVGVLWLVIGGLSLAASVQSVYVRVFRLKPFGLRGIPAQVGWLCGLIVFLAAATSLGALLTGTVAGQVGYGLTTTVMLALFLWAGVRVLTIGRLGWRASWPTALFTTIGLTGLGIVSRLSFSASIVANERSYGGIGVVFTILSWLIGFGVVLIGGAIVGMWYVDTKWSVAGILTKFRTGRGTGRNRARRP